MNMLIMQLKKEKLKLMQLKHLVSTKDALAKIADAYNAKVNEADNSNASTSVKLLKRNKNLLN